MGFWKWLFSKFSVSGDRYELDLEGQDYHSPQVPAADCPFCGAQGIESGSVGPEFYPVWKCFCGSLGSGAALECDLDEAGDQLLQLLGISRRVSAPLESTEFEGITLQAYDSQAVKEKMPRILEEHGYEPKATRVQSGSETSESKFVWHIFWAKQGGEKGNSPAPDCNASR